MFYFISLQYYRLLIQWSPGQAQLEVTYRGVKSFDANIAINYENLDCKMKSMKAAWNCIGQKIVKTYPQSIRGQHLNAPILHKTYFKESIGILCYF